MVGQLVKWGPMRVLYIKPASNPTQPTTDCLIFLRPTIRYQPKKLDTWGTDIHKAD